MSHQPQEQRSRLQHLIPFSTHIDQHGMQKYQQRMAEIQQLYGGQIPPDKIDAAKDDAAIFANNKAQSLMEELSENQLEEHFDNRANTQEAQREAALPSLSQNESTSSSVSSEPPSSSSAPVNARAVKAAKSAERHAIFRSLNPGIDREPAKLDHLDPWKLTIDMKGPPGKPQIQYQYQKPIDWTKKEDVAALNKWRASNLGYWLGPKGLSNPYEEDEKRWIKKAGKVKGSSTWRQLAKRFNRKFKGRPTRNRDQIRLEYIYLSRTELKAQHASDKTEDGESGEVEDDEGDEMEDDEGDETEDDEGDDTEDDEDTEADEVEANERGEIIMGHSHEIECKCIRPWEL